MRLIYTAVVIAYTPVVLHCQGYLNMADFTESSPFGHLCTELLRFPTSRPALTPAGPEYITSETIGPMIDSDSQKTLSKFVLITEILRKCHGRIQDFVGRAQTIWKRALSQKQQNALY